jgi:DNA-binding beta-propeller fold protein YncE
MVLLLVAACGGAAVSSRPRVERVWPPPPAPAAARWLGEYPDPDAAPPRASWWKRAAAAVAGTDGRPAPSRPSLVRPFGLAAVASGFVVADPDARTVSRVSWPDGRATPVRCAGREWAAPLAVAVAADGTLFVADGLVVRVPPAGACAVVGAGRLVRASGVALLDGRVYVVDPPRHTVEIYGAEGRHLGAFGTRGDAAGAGLNFPTGIAAAPDGTLLVVDALNFRVSRFTADGRFLASAGEPGDGGGAFGRPKAVAVDAAGRLYVSDAQHDVVVILSATGAFELALGGSGAGPGDLTLPAGVAVSGRLLFVADSYNHRVAVYRMEAP